MFRYLSLVMPRSVTGLCLALRAISCETMRVIHKAAIVSVVVLNKPELPSLS
jgi:hypothetical protein